jgi:hypothetical protein
VENFGLPTKKSDLIMCCQDRYIIDFSIPLIVQQHISLEATYPKTCSIEHVLGLTHICGQARKNGKFLVLRKSIRKRLLAKLKQVKDELRMRMHQPLAVT